MAPVQDKAGLVRTLAEIYPDDESIRRLLDFSGIPAVLVRFGSRPLDSWYSALSEADLRGKRSDLLKVMLLERPENHDLHDALKIALESDGPRSRTTPGSPVAPTGIEKIMGAESTLLPIAFLEKGLQLASSVVRISSPQGLGTGFLVRGDRVVTNHHVIGSFEMAEQATIQFNFQEAADGSLLQSEHHALCPSRCFATSVEDDLSVIGIQPGLSATWGCIEVLDVPVAGTRRVNIIQHPGGGPKQIALYHNVVSHVDESRIQYYTDTLPGSSGSPLFDDTWRLVGVHHAGGNLYSPSEKSWVYRNEGVVVAKLAALLASVERPG
ncbi:MAG TPA: trypsin-like peptidase domain-containing protein [Kineosporiaceae bacterium]|nr:trypsin-like peptidase domain-containing protein [Kineosporiaceae bacterium]